MRDDWIAIVGSRTHVQAFKVPKQVMYLTMDYILMLLCRQRPRAVRYERSRYDCNREADNVAACVRPTRGRTAQHSASQAIHSTLRALSDRIQGGARIRAREERTTVDELLEVDVDVNVGIVLDWFEDATTL